MFLEEKRDQQEKELYDHIKRLCELKSIEDGVKSNEEAYKKMLDKEHMEKEKENHQFDINQLQRQIQLSKERIVQHRERTLTLPGLEREQALESKAKIDLILAKEDLERHKKLREERNKLELVKQEAHLIKYNPNELQIAVFNCEFKNVAEYRNALEHEKLRYSMIRKANDDMLHELLETKTNASKI
jgi:hypothetical protein